MTTPLDPPPATAESLVARLEAARVAAGGRGVIAFDADGTLWAGDVGNDVFDALLAARAVRREAHAALRDEALRCGVALDGEPTDLAARLYAAYVSGAMPEEDTCAMMAWSFAGFTAREALEFGERVVEARGVAARMHAEIAPVLAWALGTPGVEAFVVSASPRPIVEPAVARVGLRARVIAATPARDGDVYAPRIEPPMPYGDGKARALAQAAPGLAVLGAFGDNAFDVALLRAAAVPVAVRPKPALLARAHLVPGLATLARIT